MTLYAGCAVRLVVCLDARRFDRKPNKELGFERSYVSFPVLVIQERPGDFSWTDPGKFSPTLIHFDPRSRRPRTGAGC